MHVEKVEAAAIGSPLTITSEWGENTSLAEVSITSTRWIQIGDTTGQHWRSLAWGWIIDFFGHGNTTVVHLQSRNSDFIRRTSLQFGKSLSCRHLSCGILFITLHLRFKVLNMILNEKTSYIRNHGGEESRFQASKSKEWEQCKGTFFPLNHMAVEVAIGFNSKLDPLDLHKHIPSPRIDLDRASLRQHPVLDNRPQSNTSSHGICRLPCPQNILHNIASKQISNREASQP